jgi:RNA-directed DNA polymerase
MKVPHGKDPANHSGPKSCGDAREGVAEALTGDTGGSAIEPRNPKFGPPTLYRSWEISAAPGGTTSGGPGKAKSRTPGQHRLILPGKPSNKGDQPAEMVEGRSAAKGNADKDPAPRTQSRTSCASMGLEGIRQAARRNRRLQFTALLHHITPQLLADSFYSLQKNAAAGVEGVTWRDYEEILPRRVTEMHRMIQSGAYRAMPSRRVCIPKADGRQRLLGIASGIQHLCCFWTECPMALRATKAHEDALGGADPQVRAGPLGLVSSPVARASSRE